jgi:CHAT domain/Effector-associated domain 11
MEEQTKDIIRKYIADGKLDKAIIAFENWAKANGDDETKNMIILKRGEYRRLTQEEGMGLLSSTDARIQRARINMAILSMVDDVENASGASQQVAEPINPAAPIKNAITGTGTGASSGTILFLAANPTDTAKLQLEKEFVLVLKNLDEKSVTYTVKSEFAVTASLLQSALLKYRPRIVHFSGHGEGSYNDGAVSDDTRAIGNPTNQSGIVLQTADGKRQLVSGAALANLFKVCLKIFKLEVVLLNACSSEEQALAIFNVGVPFVIGMNAAVKDASAIQFSAKFYEGLASEGNVEIAFELAKAGVMLENGFANDADIPVLYMKTA